MIINIENYKISIIIPVYNNEQYLSQAFNSLLRQTIGFDNLQVLFTDDCSTDKSREIIDTYSEEYPNVFSFSLAENSGTGGKPRNIGMKHAVADYYMFLDADDWFADNACEVLFEKIIQSNADIVSGYYSIVNQNGKILFNKTPQYQAKAEVRLALPDNLEEAYKLRSPWCNKIYKKTIIEENKITFPIGIIGQDQIFFTRYLLYCKSFQYVDQQILFYRQRTNDDLSISNNHTVKYFLGGNKYLEQMVSLLRKNNHDNLFEILISETFQAIIMNLIDSQKLSEVEILSVLKSYRWVFYYSKQQNLFNKLNYISALSEAVLAKNYTHALDIILAIRAFRFESLQLLEGKAWLEKQLDNHIKALNNLKVLIKEQQETIDRYHVMYWVKKVLKKFIGEK